MRVVSVAVAIVATYVIWLVLSVRAAGESLPPRHLGVYDPTILRLGISTLFEGRLREIRQPVVLVSLLHSALVLLAVGFVLVSLLVGYIHAF